MKPASTLALQFDPKLNALGKDKELRHGLSVALQVGNTLWVANDETVSLERLSLTAKGQAKDHKQFALSDYLRLPVPPPNDPADLQEADIEGLDHADGYLWLVGSHSLKRAAPASDDSAKDARKALATLSTDGNRYLLARIPIVDAEGECTLAKTHSQGGRKRRAGRLRGDHLGNELTAALRKDTHLAPFLAIPGKDNGFDIEGLAVVGKRILLGLRGPVLRGWATILEIEPRESAKKASSLRLKPIGPNDCLYRKHFLDLGGLGVRDLCVHGKNLLILAGPTMDLDGPVTVFRWLGGAKPKKAESVVPASVLERVLDLPYGQQEDHAEGITLSKPGGMQAPSLLVVYDSASRRRLMGSAVVKADVFKLPPGA